VGIVEVVVAVVVVDVVEGRIDSGER